MKIYYIDENGILSKFEGIQLFIGTRTITLKYRTKEPSFTKFRYISFSIEKIQAFEINGRYYSLPRFYPLPSETEEEK